MNGAKHHRSIRHIKIACTTFRQKDAPRTVVFRNNDIRNPSHAFQRIVHLLQHIICSIGRILKVHIDDLRVGYVTTVLYCILHFVDEVGILAVLIVIAQYDKDVLTLRKLILTRRQPPQQYSSEDDHNCIYNRSFHSFCTFILVLQPTVRRCWHPPFSV